MFQLPAANPQVWPPGFPRNLKLAPAMTDPLLVQVWTYEGRVAFVLSVTERNLPVAPEKLPGFYKMLMHIMDPDDQGIVRTWMVGPPFPLACPTSKAKRSAAMPPILLVLATHSGGGVDQVIGNILFHHLPGQALHQ